MSTQIHPLEKYFIGWQCRIRQQAVRKDEGRPCEGMIAGVYVQVSDNNLGPLVTNLVLRDSAEITSEFRHVVKKTHDPKIRRESALKILSSAYYQHPEKFCGSLFATFAVDSELADLLVDQAHCRLTIHQYNQSFDLHCKATALDQQQDQYQAVYWHSHMFNATLPALIRVIEFTPNWQSSVADPAVRAA